MVRVAAIADVHCHPEARGRFREEFARANDEADALIIAGDLTLYGRPDEIAVLLEDLEVTRVPVIAVLGNHDYESNRTTEVVDLLSSQGVTVLDGNTRVVEVDGETIGFAGVKGFAGGFGRRLVAPFGEPTLKEFVYEGQREARKLQEALRSLETTYRVAVTHYAPIRETLDGESQELWPFLGSSMLADAADQEGADVFFHGHAHYGSRTGYTQGGIPVFNVAYTLVKGLYIHRLQRAELRPDRARATVITSPRSST